MGAKYFFTLNFFGWRISLLGLCLPQTHFSVDIFGMKFYKDSFLTAVIPFFYLQRDIGEMDAKWSIPHLRTQSSVFFFFLLIDANHLSFVWDIFFPYSLIFSIAPILKYYYMTWIYSDTFVTDDWLANVLIGFMLVESFGCS